MKKFLLFVAFNSLLALGAISQNLNPVKWTFEAVDAGNQEFDLILTAQIDKGWYVYSQKLPDDGPIPTSISLMSTEGITLLGEAKEEGHKKEGRDEMFDMYIVKYSDSLKLSQRIKLASGVKKVSGSVTFMTCDNNRCLPPKDVLFSLELD